MKRKKNGTKTAKRRENIEHAFSAEKPSDQATQHKKKYTKKPEFACGKTSKN